jgi:hypothetical protein
MDIAFCTTVDAKKNIDLPISIFTRNHEEWYLLVVHLEGCINVERVWIAAKMLDRAVNVSKALHSNSWVVGGTPG